MHVRGRPVLRELGRLGRAPRDATASRRFAFPGSEGGTGCRLGDAARVRLPAARATAPRCASRGARLDEDLYTGTFAQTLQGLRGATRAGRAYRRRRELELIKWRDVNEGPARGDRRPEAHAGGEDPARLDAVDNPWEIGACNGSLVFDTKRFPDPAGMIRQVHAHGVRFMLWVSPKVTCGAGYPPGAELGKIESRTLDLRRPDVVAEYQKRLRKLRALGVDGVKGDRGDEVDLEAIDPTLQNRYPVLFARVDARDLAEGGRDLPRRRDGLAGRAAGPVGRRPVRRLGRASSARSASRAARGDERLPRPGARTSAATRPGS